MISTARLLLWPDECHTNVGHFTGITEAFVHAVLDGRGIQQTNMLLVAFSVAHLAASIFCINAAGAVGLVLADAVNMVLRIACSLW